MQEGDINILIAGDYHGGYQKNTKIVDAINMMKSPVELIGDVTEIIKKSDLSIVNLEYPVTYANIPVIKYGPAAKSDPQCLLPLQQAGFNVATFATNHTYDFKEEGIKDTIKFCNDLDIEVVGAGLNINEAKKILYKRIKDVTIAILNFAETQFNIADIDRGGANPLDIIDNVKDIRTAKKNADFVIVIIHRGTDLCPYPSPNMVKQSRFYAEEGASAILYHHSRNISGFEIYHKVPIVYGLGNFIHAVQKPDINEQTGLLAILTISNRSVSLNLIPIFFELQEMRLKILKNNEKEQILNNIEKINILLKDSSLLSKEWGYFIKRKSELRYLVLLSNLPNGIFRIFRKVKSLSFLKRLLLLNSKRFLPIWNIIRNESHRESINYIFNETFKKNN